MRGVKLFGIGAVALLAVGGYAEHAYHAGGRQTAMVVVDPAKVAMKSAPIPADWILEGAPRAEAGAVGATNDGTANIYVWTATKGRFNWFYDSYDEFVSILDGDVFIKDDKGNERHLHAGDFVFFPVGTKTTWTIPDHLRKIAVVKGNLPAPLASALRVGRSVKQMIKPSSAFASP